MDYAESPERPTQRIFAIINLILVGLGAAVMAGWYLKWPSVVRLSPSFVPMQFNTAVGVALAGIGLLAGAFRQRVLGFVAAVLVFLLGAASLFEDVTGTRLGIDTLFIHHFITEMSSAPGRPSPNSSFAFVFLGAGIALFALDTHHRWVRWAVGLIGSATTTMGAVPLLGYLTGVEAAFRLVSHTGMALPAAVAFLLAGVSLTGFAARRTQLAMPDRQIDWAPWAASLSVLVAAVFLWSGLRANEAAYATRRLAAEAYFLRQAIAAPIREDLEALQRMAWRMEGDSVPPGARWQSDARRYLETDPYYALLWADRDLAVRSVITVVPSVDSKALRLPAIDDLSSGSPVKLGGRQLFRSSVTELYDKGGSGFYVFMPIRQGQDVVGYFIALVDLKSVLLPLAETYLQRGYRFVLFEDGHRLGLGAASEASASRHSADYEVTIPVAGKDWRLAIYRVPKGTAAIRTALPETVLVLGLVLAMLLGIALRSRQLLATRASDLTRSKQGLEKEIAQRSEELSYLATHDLLTELPNRMLFSEHLRQALAEADRKSRRLAVICLAIDYFQEVNNSLGHAAGDDLLRAFSRRVAQCLRRSDVLARLGGDEFVVLCPDLGDFDRAVGIAEKILGAMGEGFQAGSSEVAVTTSIGVARYPDSGTTAEALIQNADAAMRQAKAAGRNTYVLYGPELGEAALARVDLRRALRYAVRNGELRVHYQPQVSLADGRIVAAEALVRWDRPGYGLVPPNSFIPLAEESDLIVQIDSEVLHHVAADLQRWSEDGLALPWVSINISARQLYKERLLDDFREILNSYPAARGRLEVELTERLLVDAIPQNRRVLDALIDLRVRFAIDDFGTGYSSFSYFRDFPIHTLKIDRSFIQQLAEEVVDARITLAIIGLAKTFDISVVAEGVEFPAQQRFLFQHGCTRAQGWLFGKPMPGDEFIDYYKRARA